MDGWLAGQLCLETHHAAGCLSKIHSMPVVRVPRRPRHLTCPPPCCLLSSLLRREGYRDAYLTAHFEVPGEMFSLAMESKRQRGMGVVGSTQNILDFIAAK